MLAVEFGQSVFEKISVSIDDSILWRILKTDEWLGTI